MYPEVSGLYTAVFRYSVRRGVELTAEHGHAGARSGDVQKAPTPTTQHQTYRYANKHSRSSGKWVVLTTTN